MDKRVEQSKHPFRRAFAWGMLVGTLGLGILIFFTNFLITNNTSGRDARKAEGEQLAGSARDGARVHYSQTETYSPFIQGDSPLMHADKAPLMPSSFEGSYYRVVNVVSHEGSDEAAVYCIPLSDAYPVLKLQFHWNSGESRFEKIGPFAQVKR